MTAASLRIVDGPCTMIKSSARRQVGRGMASANMVSVHLRIKV